MARARMGARAGVCACGRPCGGVRCVCRRVLMFGQQRPAWVRVGEREERRRGRGGLEGGGRERERERGSEREREGGERE